MTLKEWFQDRNLLCIKKKPVEEDEKVEIDESVHNFRFEEDEEEEEEEEKKTDDKRPTFYGSYVRIRQTLDYGYHSSYSEERQWFQDSIIETIMGDLDSVETTPSEPWLIFLMGSLCSGKSEVLQKIEEDGNFPLLSYTYIDNDDIQTRMPENSIGREYMSDSAHSRVRKEAKLISEIAEIAAMERGNNVVLSCSPLTHTWFSDHVTMVRQKYPQYKIAIIHVKTTLSKALHENAMVGSKICFRVYST